MKVMFMFDEVGNFEFNTTGVKYIRPQKRGIIIDVPEGDKGGSYKVRGIPYPIVHYLNEVMNIWVINPGGDIPPPKEVTWEWEVVL